MLLPLFVAVTFGLPSFQLSPQEWSRLNATVNGRLIQLAPFARPCFEQVGESVRGSFSPEECDSIVASYVDHSARLPALGQYMNTQWETCQSTEEQCLLDWTNSSNADAFSSRSCHQGSVPHYAVRVQSASDVAAAFRFSDEQKVPLVVKSTGASGPIPIPCFHDYLGRSSGAGTLAILTDGLQELVLDRAFIPKGCPASTKSKLGLTMGAGVTTQTIMDFAEDNHITIPTPGDGTVALGAGYTLAGGHSILANAFGLAADRALEFEVVTPDGKLLIANQCQNMDLFFALRGGGGGTFGVVLKTTTLAFPGMPIPSINITLPITPENQRAHIDFLVQHSLELSLQGWGGYSLPAVCMTTLANPLLNDTAAHASADILKSFAESHGGTFTYIYEPSYKHYYDDFEPPVAVGAQVALSSRLIPTDMFRSSPSRSQLSDAIFDLLAKVPSELPQSIPFPVLFASTPHLYGDDASTSSHPAWRSSLWLLVNGASWNFDTPREVIADVYKNVSEALTPIRAITPTAAYFAESDVYEPDFEESYWGSNYARLLSIKNKYDPHHLLDCWHCVGWQGENHDRYKCYLPTESVLHTEPVEILSDQETIPSDKQSPFAKEHAVRSADEL